MRAKRTKGTKGRSREPTRDKHGLNERQRAFADFYIETGNATEAARRAGYSERTCRSTGAENLTKPAISAYIAAKLAEIDAARVASAREVMIFYTDVMRGNVKDQFGLDASLDTRINAGRELMKRLSVAEKAQTTAQVEDVEAALYSTATGGNFAAQKYVLENRAPEKWRSVQADDIEEEDINATRAEVYGENENAEV